MTVSKEVKKTRSKKSEPSTIPVANLQEEKAEKPVTKKASKPSIKKVQNLIVKEQKENLNSSCHLVFESSEQLELKEKIVSFAASSGNLELNEAVLVLLEKALQENESKPEVNLDNKLNEISEKFKKLEEKMQSEFYTFKIEFIEQFQCFIEATRSQGDEPHPKENKSWLQNILKYI